MTARAAINLDISSDRLAAFADLMIRIDSYDGADCVRHVFFDEIVDFTGSDIAASYRWDKESKKFVEGVKKEISDTAIKNYENHYQFYDPMTHKLRLRRVATRVEEVIPPGELEKTEFFNDFLKPEGMDHGFNIFLADGADDIGDFRLWRVADRPAYSETDLRLMDILAPHFCRAIIRQNKCFSGLTARERDVVHLVSKGCRDKDIARILRISIPTVRTHINNAKEKRHCANRAELAVSVTRQRADAV
jgi:DNA-binding CsgD family transcriptional regulator